MTDPTGQARLKTIGLLGGMSWESTVPYYRWINQTVSRRLGGLHSARIVLWSVDFHDIEQRQHAGAWEETGEILADAAHRLELAGADGIVLATNTMHRVADQIQQATEVPLLHIADATAEVIRAAGVAHVGLLGTAFTMEQDFYKGRLATRHGLQVTVPTEEERLAVHRTIYEELCLGTIEEGSRQRFRAIIGGLVERGAEAIILGCTEISLLVQAGDAEVPLFDTTEIHATKAAEWALS